jgi:hypothetical protein
LTHATDAVAQDAPPPVAPTLRTLASTLGADLTFTTDAVADAVDLTTGRTHGLLAPVLATSGTPTRSGAEPARHASSSHQSTLRRVVRSTAPVPSSGTSTATSAADRSVSLGFQEHGSQQGSPGSSSPLVPGGSSPGGPGSAASLAGLVLALPGVRRLQRARDRGGDVGGPAYPPGSSPD